MILPDIANLNAQTKEVNKLPSKMDGLIDQKALLVGIMCEKCHKRLMELKQQAIRLVVPLLLGNKKGEQCDLSSFYKGRVMDKLSLPEQSGPEWVDGRCNNCSSTEDQLRAGAVNIVKDLENPLTTVLKGLKSQHIPSGYRSDSVLGPSSKKSNRANDKISNLHKSTENLKSVSNTLATFGPREPVNQPMYANLPKHNSQQSVSTNSSNQCNNNGYHSNHSSYAAPETTRPNTKRNISRSISLPRLRYHHPIEEEEEHLYEPFSPLDTPNNYETLFHSDSAHQINANLNTSHPKDDTVKMASNVDSQQWHGPEPSVPSAIPNRTITDLPPQAPKRSESTRFSSRLKRKKETKSAPATPEPAKTDGFFAKASQMFRKRKKERPLTYAELMRLFAPPPPPALLRAYHTDSTLNDNYQYNVHIGMRVLHHPHSKESILSVDETKCQVLIANETLHFDYVHGVQAKQVDVCSSMLSNVLPSVLHGRSVVCVAFGRNVAGRQYSLIGSRDSTQCLGLMPTAVTWLNKLNDEDRSKCGANLINITSLRLDESKTLSEFLPPVSITKIEEVGKYLDKLTLTLPAREHPNEEVLIITMQFGKAKTKKNKKEVYGSLTFVDVGTPIRKNDSGSPVWDWLHEITNSRGENNKYPESFLNLRHALMLNQAHVVALGHITPSPKDYQGIGITLNLATRLYMRHLPPHRRSQIQRLKKEKDYSSATSTGEESADTVIYRPGGVSDGEGRQQKSLPERTKGDGQEQSPQFKCGKQQRNHSDTEDRMMRRGQPRSRGGYHSDGGVHAPRTTTSAGFDRSSTSHSSQPSRSRQYALTDSEDIMKYSASPRARQKGQSLTDTEGVRPSPLAAEPKRQRQTKSSSNETPEDIRQKRVQKNQQQLKRYFELLRQQHQREKLLQQSREMQERGVSSPDNTPVRVKEAPVEELKVENVPPPQAQVPADVNKENEEVTFRSRTKSESRSKGDNRRLYTIYDTEDDGAVLNQYLDDDRGSRAKSGYKSDTTRGTYKSDGGLNKVNKDKSEISREWLSKIKKKRHMPPNGQVIDYGIIDFNDKPQVKESKRVKGSLSEDELITRGHHEKCQSVGNKQFRQSERRSEQRAPAARPAPRTGGYSTDSAEPKPRTKSSLSSGYASDGARSHRHHRPSRSTSNNNLQQQDTKLYVEEVTLAELFEQVQEVEQLVTHRMQWRGNAVADLDYFDQQIRILERRNALIESLRRKQFELLSELKATKTNLMSTDWKPDLTVDTAMNENSPGYLSALWNETNTLQVRLNTCRSKLLVETSFM